MKNRIPFVLGEFDSFLTSITSKSLSLIFADCENKGIQRVVKVPRKIHQVSFTPQHRLVVQIPYWFIKNKGLDAITRFGQSKWRLTTS